MSRDQPAILIVDDKAANLRALEETLSELDVVIVKAQSGNEALKATLARDFALCIVDVQMPEMDGYELALTLRDDPSARLAPIIFLTAAMSDEQQALKGYQAGGVDYIVKPYKPLVLLSKVNIFLELDRQRTEVIKQQAQMEEMTAQLRQQSQAILELSTPILQVWDKILVAPLIGSLDTARAEQLTEHLLCAIKEKQAEAIIIDVTGMLEIDTAAAASLMRAIQSGRILGAECVLTGIRPNNAQTLARQGVEFASIETKGTLRGGLEYAFDLTQEDQFHEPDA